MTKNETNKKQRGFSLLELMISLAVGLVLFAGVMSIFVGMRTTTAETTGYGELQENGRFAISVLSDDLLRQNFWGSYVGTFGGVAITRSGALAVGNECTGSGLNNGTFPNGIGPFRTLWGETVTNADPMGCFDDARLGSDVIQIKRVLASPLEIPAVPPAQPVPVIATVTDNFFLVTNMTNGILFPKGAVPNLSNAQVWQYQHHVYYVRDEPQGTDTVPVLMQGQLTTRMSFAPIIDGIEMIRFMYGVDTDTNPTAAGYGIVDAFISADNMTSDLWDNAGGTRILAVKIYVLARNVLPDNKYENKSTYKLGDIDYTVDDNYRRLLFSSTITLYNSQITAW
ncbi:PilW family protein [Colwellia sp. E150_009]